jgi:hypothetical protein
MIYASVIGIGKYIGSYWLNLRSYLQINNKEVNPAFTATRDIILTKYDYVTVLTGYGSLQMRESL